MGRIRSLKPELLTDENTAGLSDGAFRLFVSQILIADDYGNLRAAPRLLEATIFWASQAARDVAEMQDELVTAGLIQLYTANEQTYAHIMGWTKHQKVDHPGKPSCPGPAAAAEEAKQAELHGPREGLARVSRGSREGLGESPRVSRLIGSDLIGSDPDTSPLTRSALLEPNQPLSGPISSAPDQTRAIPGTTSTVLPAPTPVRARKSKPAAGADKPPNLHESLTLAFCEAWAARYHEAYAPTPADKSQLGRLLSARPPPEAVAALPVAFGNYLDDQDRWIADTHRHSLAFFCTSGGLNKYRTSSRLAGMDDKQRRGVSALQGWLRNTGEGSNAAE